MEGDTRENLTATDTLTPEKKRTLKQLIHDAESQLTELESEKLPQLVLSFANVFADRQDELGRTNVFQHQIHTGDARPIHQAPR